jgi:hypothetical protein
MNIPFSVVAVDIDGRVDAEPAIGLRAKGGKEKHYEDIQNSVAAGHCRVFRPR